MATNWEGPLSLLARNKSVPVQESTLGTRKGLLNLIADKLAEKAKYAAGAFDPESQINQDVSSWHKKYQRGLADQIAGKDTPEAQEAYNTTMGLAGVAPIGMIAWHGSPHKFDKFDLSKIGTGEGAQAYGHGLYLAEAPEVAATYKAAQRDQSAGAIADKYLKNWGDRDKAITALEQRVAKAREEFKPEFVVPYEEALAALKRGESEFSGSLYKTDIPDEAVARFLDWDKPLSQQAPEVQAALKRAAEIRAKQTGGAFGALDMEQAGREVVPTLGEGRLKQAGIPGIRYLDGGSRSAGQGSSNFVVFDPEMIRILERNEIPTGLKPWEPGEYQFAKGGSVADKMRDILRPRPIVQPGTDTATTGTRGYSDDLANWSFVL